MPQLFGHTFETETETGEKAIWCSTVGCQTKLTQLEIQENGGVCQACYVMEMQDCNTTLRHPDDRGRSM